MKGISPLVAAVLLIATTMTIAAVLAYWASSFVRNSLPPINSTDTECAGSNFDVYSASYDSVSKNFTIMLENTGRYNIKISVIDFFYSGSVLETHEINDMLSVGSGIARFSVTSVTSNYTKYIVASTCPQLTVEKNA